MGGSRRVRARGRVRFQNHLLDSQARSLWASALMARPRGSLSRLFLNYSLSATPTPGSPLEARREPGQAWCLPSGSLRSRVMELPAGHFSALEIQSPQLRRQRPRLRTGQGPRPRPAGRRQRGQGTDLPIVWFLHLPLRFSYQQPAGEER